jgi:hypothetical protein
MKKIYVTTINIEMPWLLKWAKRFVRLEVKKHELPKNMKGETCDSIILDECERVIL